MIFNEINKVKKNTCLRCDSDSLHLNIYFCHLWLHNHKDDIPEKILYFAIYAKGITMSTEPIVWFTDFENNMKKITRFEL